MGKKKLIKVDEEFEKLLKELKTEFEEETGLEIPLTQLTKKLAKDLKKMLKEKKKSENNIKFDLFK